MRLNSMPVRVYGDALLVALVTAVSAYGQAGAQPAARRGSHKMSAKPNEVAFIEHRGGKSRLAILEIGSHKERYLTPEGPAPSNPAWSPDGRLLAFQAGGTIGVLDLSTGAGKSLLRNAEAGMPRGRCFSADGQLIAVNHAGGVSVLDLSGKIWPVPLEAGDQPVDTLWAAQGSMLYVLSERRAGRLLVKFDAAARRIVSQMKVNATGLLGWAPNRGLLAKRLGEAGDEAGLLGENGNFEAIRASPGPGSEAFVEYLPATDRLALELAVEHGTDAESYFLTKPGLKDRVPWLTPFRNVRDLRFSAGGGWAVFTDRSRRELLEEPGGDLYLTATGSMESEILRRGIPAEVSYSTPAIRPLR